MALLVVGAPGARMGRQEPTDAGLVARELAPLNGCRKRAE